MSYGVVTYDESSDERTPGENERRFRFCSLQENGAGSRFRSFIIKGACYSSRSKKRCTPFAAPFSKLLNVDYIIIIYIIIITDSLRNVLYVTYHTKWSDN